MRSESISTWWFTAYWFCEWFVSCGVAAVLGHCRKVVYFSSNNLFYSQQTHSTSPSLDRVLLTRVFNKGPSLSIPKDMYSHSRIDPLTCTLSDRMMPSCGISMHTSNIYLSRSLQTYFHNLRRNSLLLVPQHQHHLLRKHHLSQIVGSHRLLQSHQRPPLLLQPAQIARQTPLVHLLHLHPLFRRHARLPLIPAGIPHRPELRLLTRLQRPHHQRLHREYFARPRKTPQIWSMSHPRGDPTVCPRRSPPR